MEKTMLYFEGVEELPTNWKGIPIYNCSFIIVESGRRLNFRVTKAAHEIKMLQLGSYYESIQAIEQDYRIAWSKEGNKIKPLSVSYDLYKKTYFEEKANMKKVEDEKKILKKQSKKKAFAFKFRESK